MRKSPESSMHALRMGFLAPLSLCAAATFGVAACASVAPPREQVAQARQKIDAAETDGATEYAPLEMRKAREALESAEEQMRKERNLEARRSAEISLARAELALAKAERERNRKAVESLRATVKALEAEMADALDAEGGVQ